MSSNEYSELEIIEVLQNEGLEVAQNQTKYYEVKGIIQAGDSLNAFLKTIEQVFESVEVTGRGKKRIYKVGAKLNEIIDRDDGRVGNGRKTDRAYSNLNERHLYDKEYAQLIRNFFERERLHQSFYDAWYKGIDSAKSFKKYMDSRDYNAESNSAYVYRFKSGGDIKYVGITNNIGARMSQHFTSGHLDKELYDSIEKIEYIEVESETEMNLLEIYLINKWKTEWNTMRVYDGEVNIEYLDDLTKEELWREYSYEE